MTEKSVKYDFVKVVSEGFEREFLVVEYNDHPFKGYWVKLGGVVDVTVRDSYGKRIVGIGAKKFDNEIEIAILKFKEKQNLETNRTLVEGKKNFLVHWGSEDEKNIH